MKLKLINTICILIALVSTSSQATLMGIGDYVSNGSGSYTLNTNGASDSELDSFLGLQLGTIDGLATSSSGNLVTEGSALTDSFMILAGGTLAFDWMWTSTENANMSQYNDFSFVTISLNGILDETFKLADTFTPDGTSGSFLWTATETAELTFGISAVDVGDTAFNSLLSVSNITYTKVPEPSTLAFFALGLAGLASRKFKRS